MKCNRLFFLSNRVVITTDFIAFHFALLIGTAMSGALISSIYHSVKFSRNSVAFNYISISDDR